MLTFPGVEMAYEEDIARWLQEAAEMDAKEVEKNRLNMTTTGRKK